MMRWWLILVAWYETPFQSSNCCNVTAPMIVTTTALTVTTTLPAQTPVYKEVWFIVVVTVGAIVLSVVLIGVICKCCCRRTIPYAYNREQVPVPIPSPRKPPPYSAHIYDGGRSFKEDKIVSNESLDAMTWMHATFFSAVNMNVMWCESSSCWHAVRRQKKELRNKKLRS